PPGPPPCTPAASSNSPPPIPSSAPPAPATPTAAACWTPSPTAPSPPSRACRPNSAACPTAAPLPPAATAPPTPSPPSLTLPRRSPATTRSRPASRRTAVHELRTVTAGYDRRAPAVRGASLTVAAGEAVGLLGPSGCGKSTLARVAALLHRPDAGTVLLDGTPVRHWRHRAPRAARTAFGVVFQQPRLSADP